MERFIKEIRKAAAKLASLIKIEEDWAELRVLWLQGLEISVC